MRRMTQNKSFLHSPLVTFFWKEWGYNQGVPCSPSSTYSVNSRRLRKPHKVSLCRASLPNRTRSPCCTKRGRWAGQLAPLPTFNHSSLPATGNPPRSLLAEPPTFLRSPLGRRAAGARGHVAQSLGRWRQKTSRSGQKHSELSTAWPAGCSLQSPCPHRTLWQGGTQEPCTSVLCKTITLDTHRLQTGLWFPPHPTPPCDHSSNSSGYPTVTKCT